MKFMFENSVQQTYKSHLVALFVRQLEIVVDPSKPLGQRSCLVSNAVPQQPQLLDYNVPIPRCALTPPCANSAQMLVWHPRRGRPVCVIPPVWKTEAHRLKRDSKL